MARTPTIAKLARDYALLAHAQRTAVRSSKASKIIKLKASDIPALIRKTTSDPHVILKFDEDIRLGGHRKLEVLREVKQTNVAKEQLMKCYL